MLYLTRRACAISQIHRAVCDISQIHKAVCDISQIHKAVHVSTIAISASRPRHTSRHAWTHTHTHKHATTHRQTHIPTHKHANTHRQTHIHIHVAGPWPGRRARRCWCCLFCWWRARVCACTCACIGKLHMCILPSTDALLACDLGQRKGMPRFCQDRIWDSCLRINTAYKPYIYVYTVYRILHKTVHRRSTGNLL